MRMSHRLVLLFVWAGVVGCSGGGGGGQEAVCESGDRRCGAAGPEVCSEDGLAWVAESSCMAGATCEEGVCLCGEGMVPTDEGCVSPASEACAQGFGRGEGVAGCYPTVTSCGDGEALNAEACVPVGVSQCAAGMAVRSDGEGCEAVLTSCDTPAEGATWGWALCDAGVSACSGEGKWADVSTEGASAVAYVDASAAAGGDGSEGLPYQSLGEAVQAVPSGALILLAKGSYEAVKVTKGVRIAGKCAGEVVIDGGVEVVLAGWLESQSFGVWVDTAEEVSLSGVTLRSASGEGATTSSGLLAGPGSSVTVEDVRFEANVGACLALVQVAAASVSRVECMEVLALDTSPLGANGLGLYVEGNSGSVMLEASRFYKVQGYDVYVKGGSALVSGNWFEGRGVWSGQEPMGIRVQDSTGKVEITGNRFKDKMQHALYAENSEVEFTGNKVDGLISDYEDMNGPAVKLVSSSGQVNNNVFSANQYGGIDFEKSSGSILGNLIEGTMPSDPGLKGGDGIVLVGCEGEPVVVQNNTLVGNTRNGVLVSGSDAEVVNNVITDTQPSPLAGGAAGAGINVVAKSSVKTMSNRVLRTTGGGIRYDEAFGQITANEVDGVEEHPAGGCSAGIQVTESFLSGVLRNSVSSVAGTGILVNAGKVNFVQANRVTKSKQTQRSLGLGIAMSTVNGALVGNVVTEADDAGMLLKALGGAVTDNTVEACGVVSGVGGIVVVDTSNPTVEVERNTVRGCVGRGMVALNLYGQFKNNVVVGTLAGEGGFGVGIWVQGEGQFSLSRNRVEESVGAGILALEAPSLTIGSTWVRGVSQGTLPGEGKAQKIADGIVLISKSVATVVNCKAEEAGGAGVFVEGTCEATVANTEFVGNVGVGLEVAGTVTEERLRFSGNGQGERLMESSRTLGTELMDVPSVCCEDGEC